LVDSRYIVGNDLDTVYGVCIQLNDNYAKHIEDYLGENNGDGTVTTYSATIGNTVSSSKNATHVGVISAEDSELDEFVWYNSMIGG